MNGFGILSKHIYKYIRNMTSYPRIGLLATFRFLTTESSAILLIRGVFVQSFTVQILLSCYLFEVVKSIRKYFTSRIRESYKNLLLFIVLKWLLIRRFCSGHNWEIIRKLEVLTAILC